LFAASLEGHCDVVKRLLSSGADINVRDENGRSSHKLISGPELSKHLTTSKYPFMDVTNNGDCPHLSDKLITAPELSKHLTTSLNVCLVLVQI
jgi:ankyrin repeat protein